jgi:hypothetical protein
MFKGTRMSPVCARGRGAQVGADGRRGPNNAQSEHGPRAWVAAAHGNLQQRTPAQASGSLGNARAACARGL